MNRPSSPIRHDYKPSAEPKVEKKSPLPWFAAGLGVPLLGIALVLTQAETPAPDAPLPAELNSIEDSSRTVAEAPTDSQTEAAIHLAVAFDDEPADDDTIALPAEEPLVSNVVNAPEFHPPLQLAPEYDRLQLTIKRGDTLDRLFRKNGLDLGQLAMMLKDAEAAPHLKKLIPGDELIIEHDEGSLISLYRELSVTSAMRIENGEDGFSTTMIDRPLEVVRKRTSGKIENSLYLSAVAAGIRDKTIMNLAGIFAWDVDFVLDIRSGDSYRILYEELYQDGEYIGDGEIIAAEFVNNGRTIQAIRFVDKNGRADYFTPDGKSIRKAFLRAPVDFRVSSSFNPNRRHPVLKTVRPHRGTDYAAPRGTPIKAAGDGKVIFRGVKSGYGNVVILQHGGNISTLYAHMSKFASNVRNGTRVRQGQTIGYVGKTGLVTGVHLHYEYRVNGVHRNSRTVSLPQADPISEEYRSEFLASVEPLLAELTDDNRAQIATLNAD